MGEQALQGTDPPRRSAERTGRPLIIAEGNMTGTVVRPRPIGG